MKTINVTFTDAEYRKLLKAKRDYNQNWRSFIVARCGKGYSVHKTFKKEVEK